jgi:hypothetical protein
VNDEDRKRERERVRRLELHFRQFFRCRADLVSSLKRRERETRECTKREKRKEKKKKKEVCCALICKRRRKRKGQKKGGGCKVPLLLLNLSST